MKKDTDRTMKFFRLKGRLGLPTWQVKGLLQAIWDFTAINAPRGDIGRFSNKDIALGIEYATDAEALIEALITDRWLDVHPDPAVRLVVHDWHEHCEDWVRLKVARNKETYYSAEGKTANPAETSSPTTSPTTCPTTSPTTCPTTSPTSSPTSFPSRSRSLSDTLAESRSDLTLGREANPDRPSADLHPTQSRTRGNLGGALSTMPLRAGPGVLDEVLALEAQPEKVRGLWQQRLARLRAAPGGTEKLRDLLEEINNRGDPRLCESKGYNGTIENPARWLNAETERWLEQNNGSKQRKAK